MRLALPHVVKLPRPVWACLTAALIAACAVTPPPPESEPPTRELVEFQFSGHVEDVASQNEALRTAIKPGAEIRGAFRWPGDAQVFGDGSSSQLAVYVASGEDVGQALQIGDFEFCTYAQRSSSTVTVHRKPTAAGWRDQLMVAQDCVQPQQIEAGENYVEAIFTFVFGKPKFTLQLDLPAELRLEELASAEVVIAAYPTERVVPSVPLVSLRTGDELYRIRGTLDSLTQVRGTPARP